MADLTEPSLRGRDAACWREAIKRYNERQKKGPKSEKYISMDTRIDPGLDESAQGHSRELMDAALKSYKDLKEGGGQVAKVLAWVLHAVGRYSRAVDVFIQCDPAIASLVWGSVRVLLQIGEEEERTSQIAAEGIIEIIRHADRWEQVADMPNLLNPSRLREMVLQLYVTVLDFLQSSKKWLSKSRLERLGVSFITAKGDKFEEKLTELKRASDLVDKELQTQSTRRVLSLLGTMTPEIDIVKKQMDTVLEQGRHLSHSAIQLRSLLAATSSENAKRADSVLQELQELPQTLTAAILDQIRHSISTMDLARVENWLSLGAAGTWPLEPRTEGTCEWLLSHPVYQRWKQLEDSSPTLCIYGPQGSGKSVLAYYLYQSLFTPSPSTLFYRFQRSASSVLSTPTSFASWLMLQMLKSPLWRPLVAARAGQQLQSLAGQFPQGPQYCAFKSIWAVVAPLLKDSGLGHRPTVIIDALDECFFDGRSLPGLSDFLDLLRATECRHAIFTRPEPVIVAAARQRRILDISLDKELLLPDVLTFARSRCQQIGLGSTDSDWVVDIVRTRSHGSFRWADLSLGYFDDPIHAPHDLRSRMLTLPPTVGKFYSQSLLDGARTLSSDELECRWGLLILAFQAQRPLKTAEVADALSLWPGRVDAIISRLCGPLASSYGGFLHLSHPSVWEFLEQSSISDGPFGTSAADSHGFLAERCLSCLNREQYRELARIRSYLLANYDEDAAVDVDAEPRQDSFYDYASTYWHCHLIRTEQGPSERVLQQASDFLAGLQFVYWCELSRKRYGGQLVGVNGVLATLSTWHKSLSASQQERLPLDGFFEEPYTLAANSFESEPGKPDNPCLPWLARMCLGDFYFIRSHFAKVASTRRDVFRGLNGCLGPQHPLTLTAKSGVAYISVYSGKMLTANHMYREIVASQRQVAGERSHLFLEALMYQGQSEMYMTDFAAASVTFAKLSAGALTVLGPEDWRYLAGRWWYAQTSALAGQLEQALETSLFVMQQRYRLFGRRDSFGLVVQITVAEMQLLLDCHAEAVSLLEEALEWRRDVYAPSNIARIDTELALAVAYRAAGRREAALGLAGEIEHGAGREYLLQSQFERYCQLCHLSGLLLADAGSVDKAIHLLQDTVTQAERDQNNRALLWIRLDLATLLRRRGRDGDRDQAASNFDGLVQDVSGHCDNGFANEPDPPRLLKAAEKALVLLRARKHVEARDLLDAEELEWRRPKDIWLWWGGSYCKDLLVLGNQPADDDNAYDKMDSAEVATDQSETAYTVSESRSSSTLGLPAWNLKPITWLQAAKRKLLSIDLSYG